jgi:putative N6-adenine-specific DNA methylase
MDLFAVCAPGLEPVLAAEMAALGVKSQSVPGGAGASGDLDALYRLNLWLRTATRVLVRVGQVHATTFADLVRKAAALPFELVGGPGQQVAFRVTCHKSRLYHSGAVQQRLQEAMERRLGGDIRLVRYDEEASDPAQLLLARFDRDVCTVSADSSGALLHRRGYRRVQTEAPLRETLAAAILLAAHYDGTEPLLDPMCGSGTIAIEAASIARRRAPGLARRFAFEQWPGHDGRGLQVLRARAQAQELPGAPSEIVASDADATAANATRENAASAGVTGDIEVECKPLREARMPPGGLIATNPPYGVRLHAELGRLYGELGAVARRSGSRVVALVPEKAPAHRAQLAWKTLLRTSNGGLRVQLVSADPVPPPVGKGVGDTR